MEDKKKQNICCVVVFGERVGGDNVERFIHNRLNDV